MKNNKNTWFMFLFLCVIIIISLFVVHYYMKSPIEYFDNNIDIIKGEKFQQLAEVYLGNPEDFAYNHMMYNDAKYKDKYKDINQINEPYNNPKIVFCYGHCVHKLSNVIDTFMNDFILITHNSDQNIDDVNLVNKITKNNKLIKWYSQNLSIENDKVSPIPIGIENDMHRNAIEFYTKNSDALHLFSFKTPTSWAVMNGKGGLLCASEMRKGVKTFHLNKTKNVFFNFNPNTNPNRKVCYEILKDKIPFLENIGYTENMQRTSEYKFCICPEGNGFDTHRLWECFYLQTIPIVLNTPFIQILKKNIDLPMVMLNKWEDYDENQLDYSKYKFDDNYFRVLDFTYYKNMII